MALVDQDKAEGDKAEEHKAEEHKAVVALQVVGIEAEGPRYHKHWAVVEDTAALVVVVEEGPLDQLVVGMAEVVEDRVGARVGGSMAPESLGVEVE